MRMEDGRLKETPQPFTHRGTGQASIAPEQKPIHVPSTGQCIRDQAVQPHQFLSSPGIWT